jgi:hypothetical protein
MQGGHSLDQARTLSLGEELTGRVGERFEPPHKVAQIGGRIHG